MRSMGYLPKAIEVRHLERFDSIGLIDRVRRLKSRYRKDAYGIRDYLEVLIAEGARNLLIGRVPTLRRIVKVVDTYLPANVFYGPIKKSDRRSAAYARVNAALKKIFDYDKFMDWGDGGKPTWGGRALAIELSKRIKYCPYCNAETVSAFRFADKGTLKLSKSSFDHFFPRARYPFLGVSLYNLIPSCDRCNSKFKRDQHEGFRNLCHPHEMSSKSRPDFHDGMKFDVLFRRPVSRGAFDVADFAGVVVHERVKGGCKGGERMRQLFKIDDVYSQLYMQEAADLVWKAARFPVGYVEKILSILQTSDMTMSSFERLLYGAPLDELEINKHRFAKMTIDLVKTYRKEG